MFNEVYDVIVVGAGHAGSEAAAAAANMGSKTLLITMNLQNIAQMSCNPAMGGIAKGQIVREIDALGGYSGIVSDTSAIQFKMLNKSKGPAMWSPRVQSDRMRFAEDWRMLLEGTPNLDFYQDMVSSLIIEKDKVVGVKTSLGIQMKAKTVVLTHFPQPEVLSIESNINYYDKQDGMFNKFEASDLTELHTKAKAHIMDKIPESGLYNVAKLEALEAIQLIENLVETIGWSLDYSALKIETEEQKLLK